VFGFQVASFRTAGTATRVLKEMTDATHLNGEILANEDEGATWYRIVLGRYATEDEAKRVSQDLIARSLIPEAIVIPYTPREP
jgi:septal ring-binding cell division protein DamX